MSASAIAAAYQEPKSRRDPEKIEDSARVHRVADEGVGPRRDHLVPALVLDAHDGRRIRVGAHDDVEDVDPERNASGAEHLEPQRHMGSAVAHRIESRDDEHGNGQHHDYGEQGFVPRLLLALDRPAHAFADELRVVAGDDDCGDET